MLEAWRAGRLSLARDFVCFVGLMAAILCAAFVADCMLGDHDAPATDHPSFVGAGLNVAAPSPAWTTTRYDGCNRTTCADSACAPTLRSCDDRPTLGAVESPEISDYATIGTRQYKAIRITAPGYRCVRDGDGWTCTRGAP